MILGLNGVVLGLTGAAKKASVCIGMSERYTYIQW